MRVQKDAYHQRAVPPSMHVQGCCRNMQLPPPPTLSSPTMLMLRGPSEQWGQNWLG